MSVLWAACVFGLTLLGIVIVFWQDRRALERKHDVETVRFRDERNELVYQIKELNESFARERSELLDRLTAESFREYKTQQIRLTRAQSKTDAEHPQLELL